MNYINEFERDLRLRQLRKHSIQNYISDLRHFLRYCPDPRAVEQAELQAYLQMLLCRNLSHSTLKSKFISINSFYEYLVYERVCTENPVPAFRKRYMPRRSVAERRQEISVDVARLIIRRAGHVMDKTMHLLFAKTGLRREELLLLQEKDLVLDDQLIYVPITGKRLDHRPVFLDRELLDMFTSYMEWRDEYAKSNALFISPKTGRKLHKDYPGRYLRQVGADLGIHDPTGPLQEKLTPHCWRWFFTTQMHRAKMQKEIIKYLRGDVLGAHEAWEGYLNIDQEYARAEYLRCVPRLL